MIRITMLSIKATSLAEVWLTARIADITLYEINYNIEFLKNLQVFYIPDY